MKWLRLCITLYIIALSAIMCAEADCTTGQTFHDEECKTSVGSSCTIGTSTCVTGSSCESDQCTCESQKFTLDGNVDLCYTEVGATCNTSDVCAILSDCIESDSQSSCQCGVNSTVSSDNKRCDINIGHTCNASVACAHGAFCNEENQCQCNETAIAKSDNSMCLYKVNAYCDAFNGDKCVEGATCSATYSMCVCNPNLFASNFLDICYTYVGSNCNITTNCAPGSLCPFDRDIYICTCQPGMSSNAMNMLCSVDDVDGQGGKSFPLKGRQGGKSSPLKGTQTRSNADEFCNQNTLCIPNATCESSVCTCPSNMPANEDKTKCGGCAIAAWLGLAMLLFSVFLMLV